MEETQKFASSRAALKDVVASDVMTPHVKSVPEDWTLQKLTTFLSENSITGSPVVSESGGIVGIATLSDIADFHFNKVNTSHEERMTPEEQKEARRLRQFIFEEMAKVPVEVRDIMSPIVFSVCKDTPIKEVANLMMKENLHRVFVKGDEKIVGIITSYDMLRLIGDYND